MSLEPTDIEIMSHATTLPLEETVVIKSRGPWALMWRRLRRDKAAMISLGFIVILVAFSVAAPAFESWTGHKVNVSNSAGGDDTTLLPVVRRYDDWGLISIDLAGPPRRFWADTSHGRWTKHGTRCVTFATSRWTRPTSST